MITTTRTKQPVDDRSDVRLFCSHDAIEFKAFAEQLDVSQAEQLYASNRNA
ncbi:MAG: hypothetical protein LH660_10745 [Phormidesmis sp. CAN_BIN36]|nr:hypothetical protein [Phormidesmis sp. CAN_BIN36]